MFSIYFSRREKYIRRKHRDASCGNTLESTAAEGLHISCAGTTLKMTPNGERLEGLTLPRPCPKMLHLFVSRIYRLVIPPHNFDNDYGSLDTKNKGPKQGSNTE